MNKRTSNRSPRKPMGAENNEVWSSKTFLRESLFNSTMTELQCKMALLSVTKKFHGRQYTVITKWNGVFEFREIIWVWLRRGLLAMRELQHLLKWAYCRQAWPALPATANGLMMFRLQLEAASSNIHHSCLRFASYSWYEHDLMMYWVVLSMLHSARYSTRLNDVLGIVEYVTQRPLLNTTWRCIKYCWVCYNTLKF